MPIALLTDFGTTDHYVGSVKGTILTIDPEATIVDITHDTPAHNITAAAFTLGACYLDFPPLTIFVCVVDPGVGSERRPIVVVADKRIFLAPDNGLLSLVMAAADDLRVYEIAESKYRRSEVSNTFHGRDIFAPAAAHISLGLSPAELGPEIDDPITFGVLAAQADADGDMTAAVIHIDRFGNLVTNLTPADLPPGACLSINNRRIAAMVSSYSEGHAGEPFSIIGSTGLVEISVREASAADLLSVRVGDVVRVFRTS